MQSTKTREALVSSLRTFPLALLCIVLSCQKPQGDALSSGSSSLISTAQAASAPPSKIDVSGHRVAYDLILNRVHAILHLGGRMILPAGGVDFYKFVDGGWKGSWILGQKDGDAHVAYVSGVSASFGFPLDADGDGAAGKSLSDMQMTILMRSVAPNQRLSVFANEKPVTTIDVGKDRASYDVTLPAAALTLGENRVRLTFRNAAAIAGGKRAAAAIEGIEIGPAKTAAAGGSARHRPRPGQPR